MTATARTALARTATARVRSPIRLTVALALAAPLSIAGTAAAYGSYGWPAGLAVLALGTAVLAAGLGRLTDGTRGCLTALIAPLALLIAASAAHNVRDDMVLGAGRTVTARVVDVERTPGNRDPSWDYRLMTADGAPVPGGTLNQRTQALRIGEQVTVRIAPDGTARPKLPEEIDLGTDLFWAAAVLLASSTTVLWVGLTSRRTPAPPDA
ncbi:hypothetical protein ACFVXG_23165 [Kitasatospora sp. NPDC058162]|uniref:hypothetical protein n=1 Tax=Kitasatospora sp. NPDC058162 TaxID=3346362 RepID=UPI0036D784B1